MHSRTSSFCRCKNEMKQGVERGMMAIFEQEMHKKNDNYFLSWLSSIASPMIFTSPLVMNVWAKFLLCMSRGQTND
jgi:hypothetical protein